MLLTLVLILYKKKVDVILKQIEHNRRSERNSFRESFFVFTCNFVFTYNSSININFLENFATMSATTRTKAFVKNERLLFLPYMHSVFT